MLNTAAITISPSFTLTMGFQSVYWTFQALQSVGRTALTAIPTSSTCTWKAIGSTTCFWLVGIRLYQMCNLWPNTYTHTTINLSAFCHRFNFRCFAKYFNTKRDGWNKTLSMFIFRLGLEEYAKEYKAYFTRYGFTSNESEHVEKMVESYGSRYILKSLNK